MLVSVNWRESSTGTGISQSNAVKTPDSGLRLSYVPREDDKDGADRNLSNKTLEALFWFAIGILQSILADLDQIVASLGGRSNYMETVSFNFSIMLDIKCEIFFYPLHQYRR